MRIDGQLPGFFTTGVQLNNSDTSLLEGLQQGDIIKAQIIDMKGAGALGEMVLRLADGSTIKAASKVQLQAKAGDMISFTFKEKVNGKIFLETLKPETIKQGTLKSETLKSETLKSATNKSIAITQPDLINSDLIKTEILRQEPISQDVLNSKLLQGSRSQGSNQTSNNKALAADTLMHVLKGMGIDTDVKNQTLAKSILDQGIPLSKESFETMRKLISGFPEISPKKLIFLLANGLEKDENNIEFLNQIVEGKMKSGILVQKLTDAVYKALEQSDDIELMNKLLQDIKELPISLKEVSQEETKYKLDELKKLIIEKIIPKNLIPDQLEKLQIIRKHLPSVPAAVREEIQSLLGDMEKGIDFYKEVSKQHYFYQIPLYLGEKTSTGELYIMKNREGKKRFDKNGLTAFVSIGTERLGEVDACVNMSGKTIGIQFRTDSSRTVEMIRDNTTNLYKILIEKGYKVADCSCKLKEAGDSVSIVDAGEKVKNSWIMKAKPVDIKI